MSIQPITWIVFAVAMIVSDRRWLGPDGERRLRDLDPWHASRLRSGYRSPWLFRLLVGGTVLYGAGAAVSAILGAWPDLAVGLVGTGAMALAARSRRVAAPQVLAVLDERDLPVTDRETSRRRTRWTLSLGSAAVVLFLVSGVLLAFDDTWGSTAAVVAVALAVLALVAVVAMAWAGVWIYGDERPAQR